MLSIIYSLSPSLVPASVRGCSLCTLPFLPLLSFPFTQPFFFSLSFFCYSSRSVVLNIYIFCLFFKHFFFHLTIFSLIQFSLFCCKPVLCFLASFNLLCDFSIPFSFFYIYIFCRVLFLSLLSSFHIWNPKRVSHYFIPIIFWKPFTHSIFHQWLDFFIYVAPIHLLIEQMQKVKNRVLHFFSPFLVQAGRRRWISLSD